jgi:hypothetical protein
VALWTTCSRTRSFSNSRFTSKAGIPSQTAARFTRVLIAVRDCWQAVTEAAADVRVYRFELLMERVRV